MKICTILGTRPEIIRLSRIIPKLDKVCDHRIIWTGQNYDPKLNDIFWEELNLRQPDWKLESKSTGFGAQMGKILQGVEDIFHQNRPDRVLILGDTNSGLSALVAARLGIPVFHMEAGNRCFDNRVPEEVNRRVIDHSSTINMPYTERSRDHLLQEGFPTSRIIVTGNPIGEVLPSESQLAKRTPWEDLRIGDNFFLATFHRSENVDDFQTLDKIVSALHGLAQRYGVPILCSIHPRTRNKLENFQIGHSNLLEFCEPFGFFDFVSLEKQAKLVLTDSGTVQEECAIIGTPCVVMRNSTERIECVECGASIVAGTEVSSILNAAKSLLEIPSKWEIPVGYNDPNVSTKVVNCLQGHL